MNDELPRIADQSLYSVNDEFSNRENLDNHQKNKHHRVYYLNPQNN